MTDLEKAREFFGKDTYASETTGIVIEEVAEHYAVCSLAITAAHKNAYGGVMGGAIFTLADYTFAVASNFNSVQTVSVSSNISFIGAAKGTKLTARSSLIKDGRSTCLYSIEINDELGTKVAFVTINGMKLAR
ncbi:PaaI family thioesterase [Treponema rectale]|uniref:Acyl-CoA thioesterase n=1 Tax=Treponema rectale TaxID=744512 RepID=A0A840SGY3_9SPIR|nr:PaaI family thioesterase [Treponema rectale]MBB5220000.1 acyl-CoA thioesterase [Treponema rectale]QOS40680.1 PaaI family thioesterase [Treponema rectale]